MKAVTSQKVYNVAKNGEVFLVKDKENKKINNMTEQSIKRRIIINRVIGWLGVCLLVTAAISGGIVIAQNGFLEPMGIIHAMFMLSFGIGGVVIAFRNIRQLQDELDRRKLEKKFGS